MRIIFRLCLVGLLVSAVYSFPAGKEVKETKSYVEKSNSSQKSKGDQDDAQALRDRQEALAAQYHFASDVQDGISDLTQQREEIRDGLNVKGFYQYSDGHYRRKVSYEADENGYRVIGEEVEPLEGPRRNPEGAASVHAVAHGSELVYTVLGDDTVRHQLHAQREHQREHQSEHQREHQSEHQRENQR